MTAMDFEQRLTVLPVSYTHLEALSELLDQIDDMLIWIGQHGSNTELVYCPKKTREIVSR